MLENNAAGMILIREKTELPASLVIETEIFLPGWKTVRNMNGYQLSRKFEKANWTFFYIADDIKTFAIGRAEPATLQRAVRRALAKRKGQQFNSLEITKITAKKFLGIPYVRVVACRRHIQMSSYLTPPHDIRMNWTDEVSSINLSNPSLTTEPASTTT